VRLHLVGVVAELGHVLDDARAVALDGGGGHVKAALEQRAHQRQCRGVDVLQSPKREVFS